MDVFVCHNFNSQMRNEPITNDQYALSLLHLPLPLLLVTLNL